MVLTKIDLMKMSQAELDALFQKSTAGEIPNGDSRGTAIVAAGYWFGHALSSIIKLIAWQGKVFAREQDFLFNKITPFRLKLVKAQVYRANSWLDGKEAIILDYSKTSFVAQKIRDEIREVSPGIYLGQVFWGETRIMNFILEF